MGVKKNRWWLYILELESGKWYVGITSKTPEERFSEHLGSVRAAYWTMKYKPVKVELVEDLGVVTKQHAEKYENIITRSLMKERGINNVRGGDLRDVKDYAIFFGYIWDKEGLKASLYTAALMLALLAFCIDKYLVRFLPGGV